MTIAVKTHERGRVKTYRRAVLIVRNAHEAILALANFDAAGHTNIANDARLLQGNKSTQKMNLQTVSQFMKSTVDVEYDFDSSWFDCQ